MIHQTAHKTPFNTLAVAVEKVMAVLRFNIRQVSYK
jgi:hypothetical protein